MFYPVSKAVWLVAAPTNALMLITAAASLWSVLGPSKCAAWLAVAGACGLIIGGFSPLSHWLTVPLENRFPQWEAGLPGPIVDGIIVLGGEAGDRIIAFAELMRRFPQARLVYSGPGEHPATEDLLDKFVRLGGDRKRVTHESRSRNTFENAVYSRELIKPHTYERWLLVTAAMHMPRAIGCFRRAGFEVEAYPTAYSAKGNPGSSALAQLDAAMKEWIGLVVYWLTGRISKLFPAP
jgi:uncharacterized SAM-binding protein YcdF (DUF218 family)